MWGDGSRRAPRGCMAWDPRACARTVIPNRRRDPLVRWVVLPRRNHIRRRPAWLSRRSQRGPGERRAAKTRAAGRARALRASLAHPRGSPRGRGERANYGSSKEEERLPEEGCEEGARPEEEVRRSEEEGGRSEEGRKEGTRPGKGDSREEVSRSRAGESPNPNDLEARQQVTRLGPCLQRHPYHDAFFDLEASDLKNSARPSVGS